MKRYVRIYCMLVAMAIVGLACEKNEVTPLKVTFTSAIQEPSGALVNNFEEGSSISVTAYNDASLSQVYASGVQYSYSSGKFTSTSPIKYTDTQTLRYRAVYPYQEEQGSTFNFEVKNDQSVHSNYAASNLMVALTEATDENTPKLTFHPVLSWITVQVASSDIDLTGAILTLNAKNVVEVDLNKNTYIAKGASKEIKAANHGYGNFKVILAPQTIETADNFISITTGSTTLNGSITTDVTLSSGEAYTYYVTILNGVLTYSTEKPKPTEVIIFEDETFEAFLLNEQRGHIPAKVDANGDGAISLDEAAAVTALNLAGEGMQKITNLSEIKHFTKLTTLNCSSNSLIELDLSMQPELAVLYCNDNALVGLDLGVQSELTKLYCNSNALAALDLSTNTKLTELNCDNNTLTTLNLEKNVALVYLNCKNNLLAELLLEANTKLTVLDCSMNELTTLNLSNNTKLTELQCDENRLTLLDVSFLTHLCWDVETSSYLDQYLSCGNQKTEIEGQLQELSLGLSSEQMAQGKHIFNPNKYENSNAVPFTVGALEFKDPVFKQFLLDIYKGHSPQRIDSNRDGEISHEEAAKVTTLNLNGSWEAKIKDLSGIQHFTALTTLNCKNNELTELNISANRMLSTLFCSNNNLTTLDVSQNTKLVELDCSYNVLKDLVLGESITHLKCQNNALSTLDISGNSALTLLYCNENMLTELILGDKLTELAYLRSFENKLSTLDVTKLPSLGKDISSMNRYNDSQFYCGAQKDDVGGERILTLDITKEQLENDIFNVDDERNKNVVSDSMQIFFEDAVFKKFLLDETRGHIPAKIDTNGDGEISPDEASKVTVVKATGTLTEKIESLHGIEHFTALEKLYCSSNALKSLDVSQNTKLTLLHCYYNDIESLNVDNNTELTVLNAQYNLIEELNLSENVKLKTLNMSSNKIAEIDLSSNIEIYFLSINNNQLSRLKVSHLEELGRVPGENGYIYSQFYCGAQSDGAGSDRIIDLDITVEQVTKGILKVGGSFNKNIVGDNVPIVFEDENFLAALLDETNKYHTPSKIDESGDGTISYSEAAKVTELDVTDSQISDLSGIEYFTILSELQCQMNDLEEFDVSNNGELTMLFCYENDLKAIDVSNNSKLITLNCASNFIESINLDQNRELNSLSIGSNLLESINISNNSELVQLRCENNKIETLEFGENNGKIELIYCEGNKLSNLDVSSLNNLGKYHNGSYGNARFYCGDQKDDNGEPRKLTLVISEAQLGKNIYDKDDDRNTNVFVPNMPLPTGDFDPVFLKFLLNEDGTKSHYPAKIDIDDNGVITQSEAAAIIQLDLDGTDTEKIKSLYGIEYFTALTSIGFSYNEIVKADLSKNSELTNIICLRTSLMALDVSQNKKLKTLRCAGNQLTILDLSKNENLLELDCGENQLLELNLTYNKSLKNLQCDQNRLTSLNLESNPNIFNIDCYGNQLSVLDVSHLQNLGYNSSNGSFVDYYFYCGKQTDGAGGNRTLALTITDIQLGRGIFKASSGFNTNITTVKP